MFLVEAVCDNCGSKFNVRHRKRLESEHHYCSKKCEGESKRKESNVTCEVCGKQYRMKPSAIARQQHFTCSRTCLGMLRQTIYLGDKNPNHGNIGPKNPMFKNFTKITNYGYMAIYMPEHPFADCDGYVKEHRLVAEQHLLTDEYAVEINGKKYLSPEFEVHHIDKNRLNNDPSNLMIMTKSDHVKLHIQQRRLQ